MDYSTLGLPVHHQLPEPTQTHVHWVGDAIQPSHPLSSPSPPAFNLSQHQGLFKWVSSLMPSSSFFESWVLSQLFHCPLSPSTRGSLVPLCFLPKGWCHLHIWGYCYFSRQSWFQLVLHLAWHFVWCTMHRSLISRVTVYSLDILLSPVWTSLLFHVWF